jgi:hypothetical protein
MAILTRKKEEITRAEMLRQRRGSAVPVVRMHSVGGTAPAVRLPSAGNMPPAVWEPRVRRAAPRAHRRIRLEEPGVEVQIPAVSLSMSPRGLALTLAVVAGGVLLFLLTAAMFQAGQPVVEGVDTVAAADVAAAAKIQGVNLFLISPLEIEKAIINRIPGIRQVSVEVGLSGAVTLRVAERAPILLWHQNGQDYWVDADGVIFPVTRPMEGLVRVEVRDQGPALSVDGTSDIDPGVVINALEMAVSLPRGSQIVFDAQHGLGMMEPSGLAVYFGNSGHIEQKMEIYQRLAQRFVAMGIRPHLVDVENIWQPFYLR